MKYKKKLVIISLITFSVAILFLSVLVKMIAANGVCVDNPFGYSAMKLKESGGDYACYCSSSDRKLLDFSFDEDGIKIINDEGSNNIFSDSLLIDDFEGDLENGR